MLRNCVTAGVGILLWLCLVSVTIAQPKIKPAAPRPKFELSPPQVELLELTVERATTYLSTTQSPNGSFAAPPFGQPGITGLCSLALLSAGAVPDDSPEGTQLRLAIDFVLSTQNDEGLFSRVRPEPVYRSNNAAHAAIYNHAIAGLMLAEVYGMTSSEQNARIEKSVTRALAVSRKFQTQEKRRDVDVGGWKYYRRSPHTPADSDVSVTAWQLKFLRSAKNAGFEVPKNYADDAVKYVQRCFDEKQQQFLYGIAEPQPYTSRGVVGAGIFALALGGKHQTKSARLAADKLLQQPFRYNKILTPYEQYHYTLYHCSQAMFQLGDHYWSAFFPPMLQSLAENQRPDGSWQPSPGWERYGTPYTVALTVLALTPHYQVLPIYQR